MANKLPAMLISSAAAAHDLIIEQSCFLHMLLTMCHQNDLQFSISHTTYMLHTSEADACRPASKLV